MTAAESLYRWNTWYDGLPENWRFQVVLWPLIAVGFLNMVLTLGIRFPFGLLVLLALIGVAAIRVPYALGWIAAEGAVPSDKPSAPRFEIANAGWLVDLNRRYDALTEFQAIWLVAAILLIAGAINMLLTIGTGFPFGLIFLLAILALLVVRVPYTAGFLKDPRPGDRPVRAVEYAPDIAPGPAPAKAYVSGAHGACTSRSIGRDAGVQFGRDDGVFGRCRGGTADGARRKRLRFLVGRRRVNFCARSGTG